MDKEAGVFLTLNDCAVLFPRLKASEAVLSLDERMLFLRIEKLLYANLSIQEIEELFEKGSGSLDPDRGGK